MIKIDVDFANPALLMQPTGQWSLRPSAKTPEAVVSSLLLHTIRSTNVDFEGSLRVGLVGSSISCDQIQIVTCLFWTV